MESTLNISTKSKCLIVGGLIAAIAAIWHLLMIIGGPSWFAFARAPFYIVELAKKETFVAPVSAIAIAILMFVCAAYAFSGAGLIRKIPLLKSALLAISLVCLARGLFISPLLLSNKNIRYMEFGG